MVAGVGSTAEEDLGAVLDLDGEFSSGREDQNADLTSLRLLRSADESFDRRNEECKGLSSTSTSLCEATRTEKNRSALPQTSLEEMKTHRSTPVIATGRV
jgi:hypothetical protein